MTQEFRPNGTLLATSKLGTLNATYELKGSTLTVTSKRVVVIDENTGKLETMTSNLQPPYSLQIKVSRDTLTETAANGQITVWHRR